MNKIGFVVMVIMLACAPVSAEEHHRSGYGIFVGVGEADPQIDIYRIGLQKEWGRQWLASKTGYVSGYFELSCNRWESGDDAISGVALSPVLVYYFGSREDRVRPYVEGGIGAAYINGTRIAGRDMSTRFQFEDRIGAGVRWGMMDVNLRYLHYSNASIKQPNHGIDILMLSMAVRF